MCSKWDKHGMEEAEFAARKSKDPSTQVGCAIVKDGKHVAATGYNGYPRGVPDVYLDDREYKYPRVVHAEANALMTALRHGVSVLGATMYVNCHPCSGCAKLAIQAGIKRIVYKPGTGYEARFKEDCAIAAEMCRHAGVKMEPVNGEADPRQLSFGFC